MSDLNTAIRIAVDCHAEQLDKAGEPYILHPLRVMLAMKTDSERIVAVLHDVAEDCEDGWHEIDDAGFGKDIVDAIEAVTRREGETYKTFVKRTAANAIGRKVKIVDIRDNLRPDRSANLPPRLEKRYRKAIALLTGSTGDAP